MPDTNKNHQISIGEAEQISKFISSGPIFSWGAIVPEASKELLRKLSTDGKQPDDKIEFNVDTHEIAGKEIGRIGENLLHMAAMVGDKDTVGLMLNMGANPNEFDNTKHNALHLAAQIGQHETVGKLLEAGTSVRHSTINKDKPSDLAENCPRTYLMIKDAEKFDNIVGNCLGDLSEENFGKLKQSLKGERVGAGFNKFDRLASRIGQKYESAKADDKYKLQQLFNRVVDDKELREGFVKALDKVEPMQQRGGNYSLEKMEWQRNMQRSQDNLKNIKMVAPVLPKRIQGYLDDGLKDFSSRVASEKRNGHKR